MKINFRTSQTRFIGILLLGFVFATNMTSCRKNKEELFSDKVYSIISAEQIRALEEKGMVIHAGLNPPQITGDYVVSPYELVVPFGPQDPWQTGQVVPDYYYTFFDQQNDEVKMSFSQVSEIGEGHGCFLSGDGSNFTLFARVNSVASGINTETLVLVSGRVEGDGIYDFQYAFLMLNKDGDDLNFILMPENTSRIWKDGDNLAERHTRSLNAANTVSIDQLNTQSMRSN